jgi:hypothetical protein
VPWYNVSCISIMKYNMEFLVQARSPEAAIRKCSDRYDPVRGICIEPCRENFLETGGESNWKAKPLVARRAAKPKAKRAKKKTKRKETRR